MGNGALPQVMMITYLHPGKMLSMNGATPSLLLYTIIVCKGKTLPSPFLFSALHTQNKADPQKVCTTVFWEAGIAQSVQRHGTGWLVHGSNPGRGEIFCTPPDQPWGPPSLLYIGYRISFLGVKWLGRGVDHPPHLTPKLKKEQDYTSTARLGLF